jgi:hypothetical protein
MLVLVRPSMLLSVTFQVLREIAESKLGKTYVFIAISQLESNSLINNPQNVSHQRSDSRLTFTTIHSNTGLL